MWLIVNLCSNRGACAKISDYQRNSSEIEAKGNSLGNCPAALLGDSDRYYQIERALNKDLW